MSGYKKRVVDSVLKERLEYAGGVVIEGAKWCGKTTTAEHCAKSVIYIDDPAHVEENKRLAEVNGKILLEGKTPRLVDEWQIAPKLWDAARFEIDHRREFGQFIFTGSSVPAKMQDIYHSGTGRFSWLRMRPMSLFESGESTGEVSLASLFIKDEKVEGAREMALDELAFLVARGGWPQSVGGKQKHALSQAKDYLKATVNSDINRVDDVKRDANKVRKVLRSLSRHQGTQASTTTIARDVYEADEVEINNETIASYNEALSKIFVVEDVQAWSPNLRSKAVVRTANTHYFVDPSIACAALEATPNDLQRDLNTFGLLFETLCIRDLRVYSQLQDGEVYHYRDKNDLECDAVVRVSGGAYGLVEVKLGGDSSIEEGAANLLKLKSKLNISKMGEPSFLMVLTGIGRYAYPREDGVLVVPIGCLGP